MFLADYNLAGPDLDKTGYVLAQQRTLMVVLGNFFILDMDGWFELQRGRGS